MELPEAVDKFREYWPDTKGTMWGEAFETICAKAVESAPSASTNSDYAAALKLYREFKKCFANPDMVAPFEAWCEERLHSARPNVA